MAAEVALSPKRSIMDFFKTPSKVTDAGSSSRKTQGLLGFFTSTPRTLKPPETESTSSVCPSSSDQNEQIVSDTDEIQIIEAASKEEESAVCQGKDETAQGDQAEDDSVGNQASASGTSGKEQPASKTGKQKTRLKTNKQGKQRVDTDSVSRVEEPEEKKNGDEDPDEQKTEKQSSATAEPQQMDYEEFKRTLLQGQAPHESENNSDVVIEKKDQPMEVDVSLTESKDEKLETPKEQEEKDDKSSDDFKNPLAESEKRQLRMRTRRSVQPASISSPLLSPVTDRKDDSDLSLHGKDILEMTYEEYLKSIGAFDRSDSSLNESVGKSEQQLQGKTENTAVSSSSTPSLYNFFSKTARSTKPTRGEEGVTMVTVAAVVHGEPTVNRAMAIKERAKNMSRRNKATSCDKQSSEDEIEVLGSETISPDVCESVKASVCTREPESVDLTDRGFDGKVSAGAQKAIEEDPDSSVHLLEESVSESLPQPDKFSKKMQATLQFKKGGGLEMSTPVVKSTDSAAETTVDEQPKKSAKAPLKKPVKRRRIIEDDSDSSGPEAESETKSNPPLITPSAQSEQRTRLRTPKKSLESDGGNENKDFTPRSKRASTAAQARAQELLMKARQQAELNKEGKFTEKKKSAMGHVKKQVASGQKETASSVKSSQHEPVEAETAKPPDQGSRRQSSRLAQQNVQEKMYIDLETESESDVEVCSPVKKAGRKREPACGTPEKGSVRKSPKKAGKLAPIFTKLKAGEEEEMPRPQEDPEIVRKRREFLMSGVPSELKRQVECTVQAAVGSEYAPFPEVSHVQQREAGENLDVWSLPELGKELKLNRDLCEEILASCFPWTSLQWTPTSKQQDNASFSFQDPRQQGPCVFTVEQKDHLLREIRRSHPDSTLGTLYDKFKTRLDGTVQVKDVVQETGSKAPRLSRRQSSEDSDVVVVDGKEEESSSQNEKGCQWTESLQPADISEIVGNRGVLKRLRNWLEEWKLLIQKEARQTARMAASSGDFEPSDSDDEDEPSQLCNTMLLVGPHGVGKTSAVYALAQQLSYKVFEVNASSSRQGRHILAQLQEATQSHQVAQRKDGLFPSTPPCGISSSQGTSAAKKEQKKPAKLVPNAFANFFKKGGSEPDSKKGNTKESAKDSIRKRKRLPDPESDTSSQSPKKLRGNKEKSKGTKLQASTTETAESNLAGCLNLTSTSLILFDEVDLVFEEDSGFLQTVQHFINTTKIPIVMTTADPGFGRTISAKFEQLIFKTPALESVTSHLQTVLLAAGLRTSSKDMKHLAAACRGDLRQALLTLQFLALSGGGASQQSRPFSVSQASGPVSSEKNTKASVTEKSDMDVKEKPTPDDEDSENEFISLRPVRKPARRIVDEDNDSGDAVMKVNAGGSALEDATGDSVETVSADALPPVHLHLHNSVLGVSHDLKTLLAKCLQDTSAQSTMTSVVEQCVKMKNHGLDVILPNLQHLLPLPKIKMPDRWRPPVATTTKSTRKRIRIADIFDSDASDEEEKGSGAVKVVSSETSASDSKDKVAAENVSENCDVADIKQTDTCVETKVKPEQVGEPVGTDKENEVVKDDSRVQKTSTDSVKEESVQANDCPVVTQTQAAQPKTQASESDRLSAKLLSDFAHFYESLSSLDSLSRCHDRYSPSPHRLLLQPGITDTSPLTEEKSSPLTVEMGAEVEIQSARRLLKAVDADVKTWREKTGKEILPDGCCLPISSSSASSSLELQLEMEDIRVPERHQTVLNTVVSNLPLTCYHSLRPINLHYLPTLRAISQAEQNRQLAKTKRRFHHYFDNIGFCLNKPTMTALCEEFPASQDTNN